MIRLRRKTASPDLRQEYQGLISALRRRVAGLEQGAADTTREIEDIWEDAEATETSLREEIKTLRAQNLRLAQTFERSTLVNLKTVRRLVALEKKVADVELTANLAGSLLATDKVRGPRAQDGGK
jgi:hypothetical protein